MVKDKFAQGLRNKMNFGVGRLSPIARSLYLSLNSAFLSLGRENEIKISLINLSENLRIKNKNQSELQSIIKGAFREIHENTFVKYQFSFKRIENSDQIVLFVSIINNKAENLALIERMALNKNDMS
jgi:molybdenum cofactor biosynthesis enzyme MoaA